MFGDWKKKIFKTPFNTIYKKQQQEKTVEIVGI